MTQVQIAELTVAVAVVEDNAFYVKAARYDEYAHEYVAYDANGQAHWGERAWDAECAAIDANREIRIGNMSDADAADDAAMYSDLRGGL